MTEQEAIGVMMTEKHCVERNIKHECDRDCVKCDLLMKDNDVLNGYDMAINALEEVEQYRAIGTPEECLAAVEKHIPKKITHQGCFDNKGVWHTWNGINGVPYDLCPNCETNLCTDGLFGRDKKIMKYCENCGQKLDWSDE